MSVEEVLAELFKLHASVEAEIRDLDKPDLPMKLARLQEMLLGLAGVIEAIQNNEDSSGNWTNSA